VANSEATILNLGINNIVVTEKQSAYTAKDNDYILADTSGGPFTITLPGSPVSGTRVIIADDSGTWANNNLTLNRNGNTIEELAENLVLDIGEVSVSLVYSANKNTWKIYTSLF